MDDQPSAYDDGPRRGVGAGRDRRRAAPRRRARAARPQRPVLVRLGQEVQEVPRRLAWAARRPGSLRAMERTAFRTCPFCEATCGLAVTLRGDAVVKVRGDADDVFSRGFLCPKGVALKDLHEDPTACARRSCARPRASSRRRAGTRRWAVIAERLDRGSSRSTAATRSASTSATPPRTASPRSLYGRVVVKALGTRSVFSASTVDQRPKEISSALMFGAPLSVPIPDVDRTMHLLMLGANPLASNGSLMTAPDMRGRLRALRARGGKLVVVDPRRSRTAEAADEHHAIRPGTDAQLLFALVHVLFAEGLAALGRLADLTDGIEAVAELAQPFTPEAVAAHTGHRGRRHPAHGARASGRRVRRRLRPDRDDDAGLRHARLVAGRRAQRADGQPRPSGRGDVHARGRGPAELVGPAGSRPRHAARPLAHARARPARSRSASCPSRRWPRRSTRPARGGCARWSRWPATRRAPRPTRAGSSARSPGSTCSSRSTSTSTRPRATPT